MRPCLLASLVHSCPICDPSRAGMPIQSIRFVGEADAIYTNFDDANAVDTWVFGIGGIVVICGLMSTKCRSISRGKGIGEASVAQPTALTRLALRMPLGGRPADHTRG